MWSNQIALTALDSNLKRICAFVTDWVEMRDKVELVNGSIEWEKTKGVLESAMKKYSWMHDVTANQKFKDVGNNLAVIALIAKFVLMDDNATSCVSAFLSGNQPENPQVSIPRHDIDYFYTREFYIKSVFSNMCCAANMIQNKIMVEKHLMIILQVLGPNIQ